MPAPVSDPQDATPPRLYLAGPEVFRPDAVEEGSRLKALCAAQGVEGLYPLDQQGDDIRAGCIALIHRADVVVANISPFRGPHMDPGTAFEIGYAEAVGLPVFLWSSDTRDLARRIPADPRHPDPRDADGYLIENFGKPENLMIVKDGQAVFASPDEAIAAAVAHLGAARGRAAVLARHQAIHRRTRIMIIYAIALSLAVAWAAGWLVDRLVGW